jgi:hypothetical protein
MDPTTLKSGGLTSNDAAQGVIGDLLQAERQLRAVAEQTIRALRAALQLAAYTFAGEAFERQVQANPAVLETWSADDWIGFFQEVSPTSRGWADPGVLAERLRQVTGERDGALAEVVHLREKLVLEAQKKAAGVGLAAAAGAEDATPEIAAQLDGAGAPAMSTGCGLPEVPPTPPEGYERYFSPKKWHRQGLALALAGSGLSVRYEIAELIGRRDGVKGTSGSIKRVFSDLVSAGVLEREVVKVGRLQAVFVWLTDLGREICAACRFPRRESEYRRLLRLHGAGRQKQHAAAVAIFAYQARRRGYQVKVLPKVEGPAEPDVAISKDGGGPIYVEVELGRRKASKWKLVGDLQGFAAVCALNEEGHQALVSEVKSQGLAGRTTFLEMLMRSEKDGRPSMEPLWVETWGPEADAGA